MADEDQGGTPPPAAPPSDGGSPPNSGGSDEQIRNFKEFVEARKEVRGVAKELVEVKTMLQSFQSFLNKAEPVKSQTPPQAAVTSAPAANAEVQQLRQELALKEALADRGITDVGQRKAIERLYRAEGPQDIGQWLGDTVSQFDSFKKPPEVKAAEPAPGTVAPAKIPPGTSNTGPSGGDKRTLIPTDILQIDGEVWRGMSTEEKRSRWQQHKRSSLGDFNPFVTVASVKK